MHGSNEVSGGMTVVQALAALDLAQAADAAGAARALARGGFAYVPVEALCPAFAALLGLRRLFGLRSPINTVARLLNPADAACSVDGVFHPPYIETHLAVAERLARPRLLVLKGGGGEAERNPGKPTQIHIWDNQAGRQVVTAPAIAFEAGDDAAAGKDFTAIWRGDVRVPAIEARIVATIALGLMAVQRGGDAEAQIIWQERRRAP
jgi:anthranilate phosphoribosyltransferase